MLNNDILRRVRYALDLNDAKLTEMFALTGFAIEPDRLASLFSKEDDEGYVPCTNAIAHRFFAGLILAVRGRQDGKAPAPVRTDPLTANDVLWYLRIALSLRDEDIISILKKTGVTISKTELSAFFRKKGHENYRPCQDQFLRNFLSGLTETYRASKK